MSKEINNKLEEQGVVFVDIDRSYISEETVIGENTVIYPDVHIEGKCVIGKDCKILPGSFLIDATIGDNTTIISSRIVESRVDNNVIVGPNSHLRGNTHIFDDCRIGNFVEMKNVNFGKGSKCAHLTYLGDANIGERVNVGCGVITANYDGKNKNHTEVGDDTFIGSNVTLIAPITIGSKVLLAAGSTINQEVLDGEMGIARSRQQNKEGYGYKYLNKE